MKNIITLSRNRTGLLVVDVQEKLMPHIERSADILTAIQKTIKGFKILGLPILVTEQYPDGLGTTLPALKSLLGDHQSYLPKTTFSCLGNNEFQRLIQETKCDQWVIIGVEAHICVLQTAKDLLRNGMDVVVLNDATSSRSIYDFSTSIAQMRDLGISIASTESVLFELVADAKAPEFKSISLLLK